MTKVQRGPAEARTTSSAQQATDTDIDDWAERHSTACDRLCTQLALPPSLDRMPRFAIAGEAEEGLTEALKFMLEGGGPYFTPSLFVSLQECNGDDRDKLAIHVALEALPALAEVTWEKAQALVEAVRERPGFQALERRRPLWPPDPYMVVANELLGLAVPDELAATRESARDARSAP